jgi:hypothetical protein
MPADNMDRVATNLRLQPWYSSKSHQIPLFVARTAHTWNYCYLSRDNSATVAQANRVRAQLSIRLRHVHKSLKLISPRPWVPVLEQLIVGCSLHLVLFRSRTEPRSLLYHIPIPTLQSIESRTSLNGHPNEPTTTACIVLATVCPIQHPHWSRRQSWISAAKSCPLSTCISDRMHHETCST